MNPTLRGKTYHLRRAVPRRYASIEARKVVWVSLHTDSLTLARQKAPIAWNEMVEGWEARLAGDTGDAEKRFHAARELAAVRGYRFLNPPRVAELPREDFYKRVSESVPVVPSIEPDKVMASAVLGGAKEPTITVEGALELFWELAADRAHGKSEDQLRRWKNPRIKAVRNFVEVVGDKPISQITADDMLEFRSWWSEKIRKEGLTANSANKDLTHLADTLRTINKMKRLGLALPLSDLAFKEGPQSPSGNSLR